MHHFRSVLDANIGDLLSKAAFYKKHPRVHPALGHGKTLGLIFLNPSTRTRVSTAVAAQNLGMEVIALSDAWPMEFGEADVVMNGALVEHVHEAAPVLGAYCDILGLRSFPALQNRKEDEADRALQQFAALAGVPVLSLESATLHPLQSLADLLTITELHQSPKRPKVVLSWAPHFKALPHCVANSFAQWVNAWGEADLVITHPPGYALDTQYTQGAVVTHHQEEALQGADFVYVKNWSATQPYGQVSCTDASWMLTLDKLKATNSAKVMHCLPVRRNLELASEVLDSPHSVVIEQAANRVWAAQAVLSELLTSL